MVGTIIVAALSLGLAASTNAANSQAAITAAFDASTGVLIVKGDEEKNTIVVGRDASGTIVVNGGAVPIAGGPSTVTNTTLIEMHGLGKDDQLVLDEANGSLPSARMWGDAGNDTFTGNIAIAHVSGTADNDQSARNAGEADDLIDGGDGTDTVALAGGDVAEIFTASAGNGRVRVERSYPHPFSLDIGAAEALALTTNGGDDRFAVGVGVDQVVPVTLDGRAMAAGDAVVESGSGRPLQGSAGIMASFSPVSGTLTIFGTALDDAITVGRKTAGNLLVNGGAVNVLGGSPTVANTSLIQVFGQDANDTLSLDEGKGALPLASCIRQHRRRHARGGTGADLLFGQAGNDTLQGKGGVDLLFGGADNDTLTGGDDNDQAYGESGKDRLVWKAGDDSDLNEGGDDIDSVEVVGGDVAERFTATANGTRVRFDRVDPEPFFLDIGTAEQLLLNARGGDDTFSATGNLAALIQIAVDGGAGQDTLLGSNGADTLSGGDGNDIVDGQQGSDVALLGKGDDIFQWDPGDGNDIVEGQAGTDTLRFNGSAAAETFDAAANGERLRFVRNVGNIVMDVNDVESVDLHAAGGADILTANDLTGTDVAKLNVNLAGIIGGTGGDAQPDQVIVGGTLARTPSTSSATATVSWCAGCARWSP